MESLHQIEKNTGSKFDFLPAFKHYMDKAATVIRSETGGIHIYFIENEKEVAHQLLTELSNFPLGSAKATKGKDFIFEVDTRSNTYRFHIFDNLLNAIQPIDSSKVTHNDNTFLERNIMQTSRENTQQQDSFLNKQYYMKAIGALKSKHFGKAKALLDKNNETTYDQFGNSLLAGAILHGDFETVAFIFEKLANDKRFIDFLKTPNIFSKNVMHLCLGMLGRSEDKKTFTAIFEMLLEPMGLGDLNDANDSYLQFAINEKLSIDICNLLVDVSVSGEYQTQHLSRNKKISVINPVNLFNINRAGATAVMSARSSTSEGIENNAEPGYGVLARKIELVFNRFSHLDAQRTLVSLLLGESADQNNNAKNSSTYGAIYSSNTYKLFLQLCLTGNLKGLDEFIKDSSRFKQNFAIWLVGGQTLLHLVAGQKFTSDEEQQHILSTVKFISEHEHLLETIQLNNDGVTSVHYSVANSNYLVTEYLLKKKPAKEAKNREESQNTLYRSLFLSDKKEKRNIVHQLALVKDRKLAQLVFEHLVVAETALMKKGENEFTLKSLLKQKDEAGFTPLALAIQSENLQVIPLILEYYTKGLYSVENINVLQEYNEQIEQLVVPVLQMRGEVTGDNVLQLFARDKTLLVHFKTILTKYLDKLNFKQTNKSGENIAHTLFRLDRISYLDAMSDDQIKNLIFPLLSEKNDAGETPLTWAATRIEHRVMTKVLFLLKPDDRNVLESIAQTRNNNGETPLHVMSKVNNYSLLKIWVNSLLLQSLKVNTRNSANQLSDHYFIISQDNQGNSPLHVAIQYGYKESVALLTSHPDLISLDSNNEHKNILHEAAHQEVAIWQSVVSALKLVDFETLIKQSATAQDSNIVNFPLHTISKRKDSAQFFAVMTDEQIKALKGTETQADAEGFTWIGRLVAQGEIGTLERCVKNGINIFAVHNVLHLAGDNVEMYKFLLETLYERHSDIANQVIMYQHQGYTPAMAVMRQLSAVHASAKSFAILELIKARNPVQFNPNHFNGTSATPQNKLNENRDTVLHVSMATIESATQIIDYVKGLTAPSPDNNNTEISLDVLVGALNFLLWKDEKDGRNAYFWAIRNENKEGAIELFKLISSLIYQILQQAKSIGELAKFYTDKEQENFKDIWNFLQQCHTAYVSEGGLNENGKNRIQDLIYSFVMLDQQDNYGMTAIQWAVAALGFQSFRGGNVDDQVSKVPVRTVSQEMRKNVLNLIEMPFFAHHFREIIAHKDNNDQTVVHVAAQVAKYSPFFSKFLLKFESQHKDIIEQALLQPDASNLTAVEHLVRTRAPLSVLQKVLTKNISKKGLQYLLNKLVDKAYSLNANDNNIQSNEDKETHVLINMLINVLTGRSDLTADSIGVCFYAAGCDHNMLKKLIVKANNPQAFKDMHDSAGRTLLAYAYIMNNAAAFRILIEDVGFHLVEPVTLKAWIDRRDNTGVSLVQLVFDQGDVKLFSYLAQFKFNVILNHTLHLHLLHRWVGLPFNEQTLFELASTLVRVQPKIVNEPDLSGLTALHKAADAGYHKAMSILLDKFDVNLLAMDHTGQTAFHYSINKKDIAGSVMLITSYRQRASLDPNFNTDPNNKETLLNFLHRLGYKDNEVGYELAISMQKAWDAVEAQEEKDRQSAEQREKELLTGRIEAPTAQPNSDVNNNASPQDSVKRVTFSTENDVRVIEDEQNISATTLSSSMQKGPFARQISQKDLELEYTEASVANPPAEESSVEPGWECILQ